MATFDEMDNLLESSDSDPTSKQIEMVARSCVSQPTKDVPFLHYRLVVLRVNKLTHRDKDPFFKAKDFQELCEGEGSIRRVKEYMLQSHTPYKTLCHCFFNGINQFTDIPYDTKP